MKKAILLLLLVFLLFSFVPPCRAAGETETRDLPILMYHSVSATQKGTYFISPEALRNDLRALKKRGYTNVTLAEVKAYLKGKGTLPEKPVLVTFDDGHYDNLYYALDILKEEGFTAVLHVIGCFTEYSIVSETAPKDEFIDWQPVLDRCLSSIAFTPSFHQLRKQAWERVMGTSRYIMQTADSIRGMIMDSYQRRNATYDILSQKRSDATLGYERVQDTQTGEYYRAENGFTDWYHGTRYRPATDRAAYLSPVSGYINWKK